MDKKDGMQKLIEKYSELFNKYDFYVSTNGISKDKDIHTAINIGADIFIVFTHKDIKETINEKMKEFIEEQNKAFKEGKGWIDIENNEDNEE